ncbi:AMP-binding protein [Wukongibacter sp. M2B1]|uniref:AMP-binding protein n=1 Tax=Wukongibacter sp. M2B1 TaxID=3088895 RepID=UPI003D7AE443
MKKSLTLVDMISHVKDCEEKGIIHISRDDDEKFVSYSELYDKSLRVLYFLEKKGLKEKDELVFQIENNENFIYVFWACILGGIVPVPLSIGNNKEHRLKVFRVWQRLNNPHLITDNKEIEGTLRTLEGESEKDIDIFKDIESKLILLENVNEYEKHGAIFKPSPQDIAFIQFSSGSTSEPKGVILTHENLITNINAITIGAKVCSEDSTLGWIPLTHDMGLIGFHLTPIFSKINQYIMPTALFIRRPVLWLKKASEHRISLLSSPNFGYKFFLKAFGEKHGENWDLSNVRLIFNGAEPIDSKLCNEFMQKMSRYGLRKNSMFPVYGMAEASLAVTFPRVNESMRILNINRESLSISESIEILDESCNSGVRFVDVGYSILDCELMLYDDEDNPLKEGKIGYIKIRGKNVTSGYYNNEEATGNLINKDGWLNTGDLGFIKDGRLFVTGRAKDIIFVNGQNFYPQDIEKVCGENSKFQIDEIAACGVFNKATQKEDINIFIRYKGNKNDFILEALKLKEDINRQMGLEIKNIIPVGKLSKTTSGKVQRYKLAQNYSKGLYDSFLEDFARYEMENESEHNGKTKNDIEAKVLKIWHDIFEKETIGTNDSFFQIGGNSLTLVQLISRIKKDFDVEISMKELTKLDTVSKIAAEIPEMKNRKKDTIYPIITSQPDKMHLPFPLTDVQMAYAIGRDKNFEIGGISAHCYVELETYKDINRLNDSFQKVIDRHEMLRTIILSDGQQKVLDYIPQYNIEVDDLSQEDPEMINSLILKERERMSHFVFKTDEWPLFEVKAFKVCQNKYHLFVGFDLLIADGASLQIILKEWIDFYNNPNAELSEIDISFRDYIIAYKAYKNSETYKRDREYWMNKLDDFPSAPALPLKKQPADIAKPHFSRKSHIVKQDDWSKLQQYAQKYNVTPSALLCTAYSLVMAYWSNQPDFALNLTVFNRYPFHKDVNKVVGDFTSLLLLDVKTRQGISFWDNARLVQDTLLEALEHRHFDGVEFIREYSLRNDLGTNKAVMPIVFTSMLFNGAYGHGDYLKELGELVEAISQTSQVYVDCQVTEINKDLSLTWDYVEELFDENIIDAMFKQFIDILEKLKDGINEYTLEPPAEDLLAVKEYNDTYEAIEYDTLHELFIEQVSRTPQNTAVIFEDESITYEKLHERSNQIAHYLNECGIDRKDLIGVIAERSIDTIANILGILKCGAAYVPVDPEYPEKRRKYILENSNCKLLLDPRVYSIENLENYPREYEEVKNNLEDIAYVIYTSGSTGRPKGVVITHRAASNTIIDINTKFHVNERDRILGISSMCFDLSVYDIFGALSTGASLVLVPDQRDIKNLVDTVKEQKITIWNSVPAIMDIAVETIDTLNSRESEMISDDGTDKVYFWSPILHWQKLEDKVFIGKYVYKDVAAKIFPAIYYLAQKGISKKDIMDRFKDIDSEKLETLIDEFINKKILTSRLMTPNEVFSTQSNLFKNPYSERIIYDEEAGKEFKNEQLRRSKKYAYGKKTFLASTVNLPAFITKRKTYRSFEEKEKVSFERFSNLLQVFKQKIDDNEIKYYYPSAGGLASIDIYIFVKENRVENMRGGIYYYDPADNSINLVTRKNAITDKSHYFTNKSIFNSSAFSVFFIYNAESSMPKYGPLGYFLSAVDTGVMAGLLAQTAELFDIGTCSIGNMDFEKISSHFNLNENQILIHTVELGLKPISERRADDFIYASEMCAVSLEENACRIQQDYDLSYDTGENTTLRLVMLSGDWIPIDLPDKIKDIFTEAEVISLGGATEASIWSIYYPIEGIKEEWKSIPYGMPMANQKFYVLSHNNELCPVGVQGALHISGDGLAQGYMNDEEKTRNAFINHSRLGKLYKTGDYGVMHKEGYIEFLGRKDQQVKIRGYRIELGEIESQLMKIEGILNAIVVVREDRNKKKYLCGYLVCDDYIVIDEIRNKLNKALPQYMIPSTFVKLDELPLTANGKVNRKALPEPEESSDYVEIEHDEPKNEVEKKLIHILEDIIGVKRIGLNDNFFDIGGDSLAATRLTSRILKEFNIEMPLSSIFVSPGIKEIAENISLMQTKKDTGGVSDVVLLSKSSNKKNHMFMIHPGSGEIEVYVELCRKLNPEFNYWAIKADKYEDICPHNISIESLAEDYVKRIRKVQDQGPYYLAGWCVGGTIAFEIARLLENMGEKVQYVGLINSLAPREEPIDLVEFSVDTEKDIIAQHLNIGDIEKAIENLDNVKEIWSTVVNYMNKNSIDLDEIKELLPLELTRLIPNIDSLCLEELLYYSNYFRTLENARTNYIPSSKIGAKVLFFEATKERMNNKRSWEIYCEKQLKYNDIGGDHVSILRVPNIYENSKIIDDVFVNETNKSL